MNSRQENKSVQTDISDSRKDSSQYSNKQIAMESSVKKKTNCSNNLKMFMVALTFTFTCKALSGAIMKSSITQIERRFGMTTSEAGLVDGSFEIGNLLMITLVSHFGAKSHIPRLIGIGCFVMGAGSLLTALPHFLMGYYRYNSGLNANPLGNSTVSYTHCSNYFNSSGNNRLSIPLESGCKSESGSIMWIYVMIGNMIRGIGESPIGPLGITYIDNFAKEGYSSFYMGILHSVSVLGPIIGYLLGSLCANLYVDIGFVDLSTITIKPTDSRWVGAWWLGFLIAGMLGIASGIPFFFFPKNLKKERRQSIGLTPLDAPSTNENGGQKLNFENSEQAKTNGLAGFFYSLKGIISSQLYLMLLISSLMSACSFIGSVTFIPKYLDLEYGISMSKSNFLLGAMTMPVLAISILLGGYISKKLKLNVIGITKLLFVSRIVSLILQLSFFFLTCEDQPVAGLTVTYNGNDPGTLQNISFSFCNSDCNCDPNTWDPVCGDDGLTYMSPCLAGCKSSVGHGKNSVFHNCSCVEANNFQSGKSSANLGKCPKTDECSRTFIYHIVMGALTSFVIGIGTTSNIVLIFKFVEPELKSLAMGFHSMVIRTLGGILAPIYYGAAIDVACLKWDINNCGKQGACRNYDPVSFRKSFFGLTLGLRIPESICFIFLLIALKKNSQKNNTRLSNNGGIEMDPLNLKEPLKNNN
ncbi:solute carrier organic anion transporter family member 1B1-like [Petaurus breviceps papuanus]|uniref:solute carrier organic anion transporter family member 1B1-like n=1 Tax=Petaurus breviceps papuanus TaxID=3040969 RepID=UPI0036DEBF38